jgi:hypothetical protein
MTITAVVLAKQYLNKNGWLAQSFIPNRTQSRLGLAIFSQSARERACLLILSQTVFVFSRILFEAKASVEGTIRYSKLLSALPTISRLRWLSVFGDFL